MSVKIATGTSHLRRRRTLEYFGKSYISSVSNINHRDSNFSEAYANSASYFRNKNFFGPDFDKNNSFREKEKSSAI